MPGASPPLVKTPIRLIFAMLNPLLFHFVGDWRLSFLSSGGALGNFSKIRKPGDLLPFFAL
jgi:hypothetical protein